MLLKEKQLDEVAEAIKKVEQQTDAELVTVLAKQSDSYYYIPTLWAAVLALLAPIVLSFSSLWLESSDLLLAQWLTFIGLALLFRVPRIKLMLVPKSVKQWRAASLARSQFLHNNLHHTDNETGVLIFVSEAERYVEIIADRGINQHVDAGQWQQMVEEFINSVKAGETAQGFVSCIHNCGELLKEFAPKTHDKDELPNHLVLI